MTGHTLFDPDGLPAPVGFSYGVIPSPGRTLYLAGITGHAADSSIASGLVDQFAAACRGVARVIGEAGGSPQDLVSMTIYTTEIEEYRENLSTIGEAYREVFGKHYPSMALLAVSELFDPGAVVELVCVAVIPDGA